MSEPFSLMFHAPITPERFRATERMMPKPLETFDDWRVLGFEFSPSDFVEANRISNTTPRSYLKELRNGARSDLGWRFVVDTERNYISCACLLWTENWQEILGGLNLFRQFLTAASDGRPGYILVQDVVFGRRGTGAAILMRSGQSAITPANADGVASALRHALPMAEDVLLVANQTFEAEDTVADTDSLLVDHFEQVSGAG